MVKLVGIWLDWTVRERVQLIVNETKNENL